MKIRKTISIKIYSLLIIILCIAFVGATNVLRAQTPVKPPIQPKTNVDTADQGRIIHIIHADREGGKKTSDTSQIKFLAGNVSVKQNGTLFYCDSAAINPSSAVMEAFGHVHIIDNDTVDIYTDYMRYLSDTKKAFLKGNVKLKDPKSTLTTSQLDYDMNTKIAIYTLNGKLVSDSTVLTSVGGTYFGETRDATFTTNVVLIDPQYTIKTDTLEYNTFTKVATFTVPTVITSGPNRIMHTTDGWWDLINKKGYFSKRPTMVDSASTLIADEVAAEDSSGYGEARGNVIYKDTVQNVIVLCNNLKTNRNNSSFLATINPVLIVKQDNDSTFIAADTLYSARFDSADLANSNANESYNFSHQTRIHPKNLLTDTSQRKINPIQQKIDTTNTSNINPVQNPAPYKKVGKSFVWQIDSSTNNIVVKRKDSIPAKPEKKGLFGIFKKKDNQDTVPKNIADVNAGKYTPGVIDSLKNMKPQQIDSASLKAAHGVDLGHNNNVNKKDSIQQEDNKSRFIEAYYNVRIYNDSLQAVGDSMYYDSRDSLFQLFKNPVMWTTSNNQISQITGDTIFLYTANNKPKYLRDWYNGLMISQADTLHNPRTSMYFNQIGGRTIEGWFTAGQVDSLRARGDAHSVFYNLDAENKYIGVKTASSRVLDFYFLNKELYKVGERNDVVGSMYPMRSVNHESLRLKGFQWLDARRPKSKYELLAH